MKYDLEFYKLIKKENGIRFITFGWAADAQENPAEYLLLVNGSPQRADFRRVRRSNICEINSFSAAAAECGFFSDTLIPANTKSLRLMARGANETQEILRLSEEEIRAALSGSLIAYKVENYSKDSENRMAMISGWAVSLAHLPLKFHILNSENHEVPCTLRLSVRNDLLRNGLIEKEELLSGFTVYFPFEEGKTYQLLIEDGNSEERENIEVYYHEPAKGRSIMDRAATIIRNVNLENIRKFYAYTRSDGLMRTIRRTLQYQGLGNIDYNKWFLRNRITEDEIRIQKEHHFAYAPMISLIVPTFNTKERFFREMADSVIAQTYPNWQLCIADGSAADNPCRTLIQQYAEKDSRIKYVFLDENYGISGNTNKALELAEGEYTALYDHDDFLEPDALFEIVKALQEKQYDVIYTDEDKFNDRKQVFEDPN
ncbi:MAG: glycosyltransferase, partial [Solobacterium sp.]|nr:glycosyltransferase [Solobacterium sp.]